MKELLYKFKKIIFNMLIIESGIIDFSTGDHEIFVRTRRSRYKKVWINMDHQHHPSCSHLEDDMFSVHDELPHGFIIKAHVESNSRKIHWFIE